MDEVESLWAVVWNMYLDFILLKLLVDLCLGNR